MTLKKGHGVFSDPDLIVWIANYLVLSVVTVKGGKP